MASKIILFLSDFKKPAAGTAPRKPKTYTCPDQTVRTVRGTRTNDAPVRYLLRAHPEVSEVICVVTGEAKRTALTYFKQVVRTAVPGARDKAKVVEIPFEENQDFSRDAIPAILERIEPGDDIYLDITGGFRNANMHLLLLSRVLSYKGVNIAGAVYSNFWTLAVEDMSHLFRLFDLVGGMQELTSLGSVRTLSRYYEAEPDAKAKDPSVTKLIECMAQLTEDITLCHYAKIRQRMEEFNEVMREAEENCSDALMRQLLGVFQNTFGQEMTTDSLIRWCVGNDMIQQALTVYTEYIPDDIMGGGVLRRESWVEDAPAQNYEQQATAQFTRGFLSMFETRTKKLREYVRHNADAILRQIAPAPPDLAAALENIILVVRLAYPDGGPFNAGWPDGLPPEKADLGKLQERYSPKPRHKPKEPPGSAHKFIKDVSVFSAAHLDALLEQTGAPAGLRDELRDYARNNAQAIAQLAFGDPETAPPEDIAAGVENIILLARLAYPGDGPFDAGWADGLPPEKAGLRRLSARLNDVPPAKLDGFIRNIVSYNRFYMGVFLELGLNDEDQEISDGYILTLRKLPRLLPGSGYEAVCSPEQLAQISRDYLYIKALRNMANHAGDQPADGQEQLLNYLAQFGYAHPAGLSLFDIQQAVLTALNNLQKAKEGKEEE